MGGEKDDDPVIEEPKAPTAEPVKDAEADVAPPEPETDEKDDETKA